MRTALIVGAGIGGLAAGVALRRAGWQVRIYERAATPRELGFALALAPTAMRALERLGLATTIGAAGVRGTSFEVRHTDGRLMRRFSVQPGGAPVIALRTALHGALLDAAGGDALRLGCAAVDVSQRADAVTVILEDGRTDTGDVLIGADGVASAIRRRLHPGEPPPSPSGFHGLRGIANGVAAHLGDLAAVGYLGDGVEAATARADADTIYWYLSLLSADVARGPRDPRALLDGVSAHFDPRFRAIVAATDPANMRLDELFMRRPLSRWGEGRVTLLGDAAHPVMPHTGQGAALALEDAVALGDALSTGAGADRLRDYERARARRTRRLIAIGPRIARMTTTRSRIRQAIRTAIVRFTPEFVMRATA